MERWGIPAPNDKRIAVRITKDAARHVRAGHPWLFDAAITSLGHEGAPGDIAVIFDDDRSFMALGLYDPASHIRVRLLHKGRPVTIDADWWSARLAAALERRAGLAQDGTTAYRCINGENDGFGGLVLDRYDSVAVLKVYSAAWFPHLPQLVELIDRQMHPSSLIVRVSRALARGGQCFGLDEPTALLGSLPDAPVLFTENGLLFEADVVEGQKTGHFLDQRENRQRVRTMARGAAVLDVFACTGGFSVYAAAGGARSVRSVDISAPALETARRNMALNATDPAVAACEHSTHVGDAFEVLRGHAARGETFDIVVVDPPSFAHKALDIPRALSAYRSLTQLALEVVRPGGTLVQSSCSSRIGRDEFIEVVTDAAWQAEHQVRIIEETGHAVDHPVTFPEGAYLKTLFLEVLR